MIRYKNLIYVNNLMSVSALLNVNSHYLLQRTRKKLMLFIVFY